MIINDKKLFIAGTAHGDGGYVGSNGCIYFVDSGTIGAVPFELIDKPEMLQYGSVIEVTNELECKCENGDFSFHAAQDSLNLREPIDLTIVTSECFEDQEFEE